MRIATLTALAAGIMLTTTFLSGTAMAQTNPSAQQLINQLMPTGTVSDTTRGIEPLPPAGSGATAPASAMAVPAASRATPHVREAAVPSANLEIDFADGSAMLTPQARSALDQLGTALSSAELAAYRFKIVGHTDTTGDAATNQSLSEARAEAVTSYLESKFGVAASRLQAKGVGQSDLLVPTPPNTPNARNRRVEIINLGK